jgi:shikimate dehydrogenase
MKVFCILSDERAFKSKSPVMHSEVLRRTGIAGVYVPFCVRPEQVGDAVRGLRALQVAGANVTVPYKESVMPHLDEIAEEASAIGAVNTIVPHGKLLIGHNTDAGGFMDMLAGEKFVTRGRTALVVGTGGAAKAILYALKRLGAARVILAGRDGTRTSRLAGLTGAEPMALASLPDGPVEADLIVNATSASAPKEAPELDALVQGLDARGWELVVDINYGREENFWKDKAHGASASFVDGLPMLAYQARRSFSLWTGVEVDPETFIEILRKNA